MVKCPFMTAGLNEHFNPSRIMESCAEFVSMQRL